MVDATCMSLLVSVVVVVAQVFFYILPPYWLEATANLVRQNPAGGLACRDAVLYVTQAFEANMAVRRDSDKAEQRAPGGQGGEQQIWWRSRRLCGCASPQTSCADMHVSTR